MDIQEKAISLEELFSVVGGGIEIHYAINHLGQVIAARWVGYLDLNRFVKQLPDLEFYDSQLHTELTNNHKELIDKAKRLIVELKLQGLPVPFAAVHHNSLECYSVKTMKYSVSIEGDSTWTYFCNRYPTSLGVKELRKRERSYVDKVAPVLAEVCEAIALIIYHHLKAVSEDILRAKYA